MEEMRVVAIEARFEAQLRQGQHSAIVGELEALVVEHPSRERLAGQLILALYRCGRQSDALHVYQRVRVRLGEELGLEPGPALQELQARVLQHDPALGIQQDGARGEHRARSVPKEVMSRRRLPTPTSRLIGRGSDVDAVADLVGGDVRLATLTGPGGVGKTRLSIEVASRLTGDWRDGVWFVELAPLSDPDLVARAVTAALGVGLEANGPLRTHSPAARRPRAPAGLGQLRTRHRSDRRAACSSARLLSGCVGVGHESRAAWAGWRVRVSSSAAAHSKRRRRVRRDRSCPSVELLLQVAGRQTRGVAADATNVHDIVDVCRRLDGIPLAIELAAARLGSM